MKLKSIIPVISLMLALCIGNNAMAQAAEGPEMADLMRSNGKIYIVVAVCLTILIGLFLYAWSIDRKISRIEKEK